MGGALANMNLCQNYRSSDIGWVMSVVDTSNLRSIGTADKKKLQALAMPEALDADFIRSE